MSRAISGGQMSSGSPHRTDPNAVGEAASVADLSDVMVRREPSGVAPAVTATNVVLFTRSRRETADPAPALAFDPSTRPAPYLPRREQFALIAGLFALSLLVHGVLYLLFNRQPEPMVSIGLEAISVEIVAGAETPAGLATDTGPDTTQATPADDPDPTPTDVDTADPEPPKPVQTAEASAAPGAAASAGAAAGAAGAAAAGASGHRRLVGRAAGARARGGRAGGTQAGHRSACAEAGTTRDAAEAEARRQTETAARRQAHPNRQPRGGSDGAARQRSGRRRRRSLAERHQLSGPRPRPSRQVPASGPHRTGQGGRDLRARRRWPR